MGVEIDATKIYYKQDSFRNRILPEQNDGYTM